MRDPYFGSFMWLPVLSLLFQLPARVLVAVLPALAAANLTLAPTLCARLHGPGRALGTCMVHTLGKLAVRGVLLPLLVVSFLELRARRLFLSLEARLQTAAGAGAGGGPATTTPIPGS